MRKYIYQYHIDKPIQTMQNREDREKIDLFRPRAFPPGFFPRNPFLRQLLLFPQFSFEQFPFFAQRFVPVSPFLIQFLPPIFTIPPLVPIPINIPFPPFLIIIRRSHTGEVEMIT